ncbi:hypothetical protein CFBP4996_27555 (plasmid) [Agrobacterium leguminum]|nr:MULTISPECIES: hypothetical protein [Agrobacterium]WFS70015.1 hypothetical protein CFBP4996_27555 [Agrobacterium leguminum]
MGSYHVRDLGSLYATTIDELPNLVSVDNDFIVDGDTAGVDIGNVLVAGRGQNIPSATLTVGMKLVACGGAITLEHPFDISGTKPITAAQHLLEETGRRHALPTRGAGAGQWIATIIKQV